MKTKRLFIPLGLIGVAMIGTGPASAAVISFLEDPAGNAPIMVTTDIPNAVIATGVGCVIATPAECASLSVGNVTGTGTLSVIMALTGPGTMHMEGGGGGVSDLLELFTFSSVTGAPIGFQALFESDGELGLPRPSGFICNAQNCRVETGTLQPLFTGSFTLPGGPVDLLVNAQSDLVEGPEGTPEPGTIVLFGIGLLGLGIMRRRLTSE